MKSLNIGICGLGLLGGSLAKAFHNYLSDFKLFIMDRDESTLKTVLADNLAYKTTKDDFSIFEDCDIVFICTPISFVGNCAKEISKVSNALITDVASTKKCILKDIPTDVRFIGGHPMAGSEKCGYSASRYNLFENAIYTLILRGTESQEDLTFLKNIIKTIKAIPYEMNVDMHERAVGVVSHLPHIIASSLVNQLRIEGEEDIFKKLASGGFKDMTRIASGDAKLWEDILLSSDDLVQILEQYKINLDLVIELIKNKEKQRLFKYLNLAKEYRNTIKDNKGILQSKSILAIDVNDKPGIIGKVATIFGENNINIKNLFIENIREYSNGALRITLEKDEDYTKALNILIKNGYKAVKL